MRLYREQDRRLGELSRAASAGRGHAAAVIAVCSLAWVLLGAAPARASSAQTDAGPPTALGVSFAPNRLGAATTVKLAIAVGPGSGALPAPISGLEVGFPRSLGLGTSGLGLAECEPSALEMWGPQACAPNSKMGYGEATMAVAFGADIVHEHVTLGLYAAPSHDGYVHMAIVAAGAKPINARIVMGAVVLPGRLQISVPAVPSVPGAQNVALLSMRATLGGKLTYFERRHGRPVAYRPRGVSLPSSCPPGGWHLSAKLDYLDGGRSLARTVVGCPIARG